jgi:hypothetical protein
MKLTKAAFLLNQATSIVKRTSLQPSAFFSSFRATTYGQHEENSLDSCFGLQTIQFYSKEIAKSEKKQETLTNLCNDPRDFAVYYLQDGELDAKVRKRRASKRKDRKNGRKEA